VGASQKLASQDLGSEFAEVDLATGARKASVGLEVEQYRNSTQWGMWKTFRQVLAELKKQQREGAPLPRGRQGAGLG
jgi:hypothetical protein